MAAQSTLNSMTTVNYSIEILDDAYKFNFDESDVETVRSKLESNKVTEVSFNWKNSKSFGYKINWTWCKVTKVKLDHELTEFLTFSEPSDDCLRKGLQLRSPRQNAFEKKLNREEAYIPKSQVKKFDVDHCEMKPKLKDLVETGWFN
ncbi:hypothetical protein D5R81_17735 [Parashewanella spongiae]|uniref:Uncharacterized protein n=1 Tax=Parashewanella spongiae TaxID=342950 RepID=A0A3A6U189_9GAMM|nr:hypothetical protein [Parashewanella spongiae]MCL1079900.1 hypothetical protein [Parashewanella spongiae]RJY06454.1 hypothetical protein D5R81_17735 [Parashewanella spongiae]